MRLKIRLILGIFACTAALLYAPFSGAQQKPTPVLHTSNSYIISRETTLAGTVLSYTAASAVPPLGAHVSLQTASGPVDVYLGSAWLLESAHFSLNPGDSVRFTGETLTYGGRTQFVVRIIQDGSQSLTLRSVRGFPLRPIAAKHESGQGGVQ